MVIVFGLEKLGIFEILYLKLLNTFIRKMPMHTMQPDVGKRL